LLFSPTLVRLPPAGLGDAGGSANKFGELLVAKGLPLLIEDLRPFVDASNPLLNNGLPNGE